MTRTTNPPQVIITGGAGFIGTHTYIALHAAGYRPVIIDNFSNSEQDMLDGLSAITDSDVIVYEGDCGDEVFMAQVMSELDDVAGVIHFAALKAVGESVAEPLRYYENNLNSLLVVLKMMREFGIPHFVFSSSATVYGEVDSLPVTEAFPMKPASCPYGRTKQMAEDIIADLVTSLTVGGEEDADTARFKAVALRYFNPIGAHESALIGELPLGVPNNLVPLVTQTAAGIRETLNVYGNDYNTPDGTCIRDYIHVMDLAEAHVAAFKYLEKQKSSLYETINVGTGKGNSVMDVIKTFEQVTGVKLNHQIAPRRQGDIAAIYADVTKAKQLLDWQSKRDMPQALKDAWAWQQALATMEEHAHHEHEHEDDEGEEEEFVGIEMGDEEE